MTVNISLTSEALKRGSARVGRRCDGFPFRLFNHASFELIFIRLEKSREN